MTDNQETSVELISLLDQPNIHLRASSTLQQNKAEYGIKHVIDGKQDTCWNSDQGLPQYIDIRFECPIYLTTICMAFQGGFTGQNANILASPDTLKENLTSITTVYPQDNNDTQEFDVSEHEIVAQRIRIEFTKSSDFYGRVIMYSLQLLGLVLEEEG